MAGPAGPVPAPMLYVVKCMKLTWMIHSSNLIVYDNPKPVSWLCTCLLKSVFVYIQGVLTKLLLEIILVRIELGVHWLLQLFYWKDWDAVLWPLLLKGLGLYVTSFTITLLKNINFKFIVWRDSVCLYLYIYVPILTNYIVHVSLIANDKQY